MSIDYFLRARAARTEPLTVSAVYSCLSNTYPNTQFGEGKDQSICLVYQKNNHIADVWLRNSEENALTWDAHSTSHVEYINVMGGHNTGEVAEVLMTKLELKDTSDFNEEGITEPVAIRLLRAKGEVVDTKYGTFTLDKVGYPTKWFCPKVACAPNCYAEISAKNTPKENFLDTLSERIDVLSKVFERELTLRPKIIKRSINEMKSDHGLALLGMNLVGIRLNSDNANDPTLYYQIAYAGDNGPKLWEAEVDVSNNEIEYIGILMQEPKT